jgi:hypothetical protein
MRALCCGLALAVLSGACASSNGLPNRTAAKVVLGAVVLGAAALAGVAAAKGNSIEKDLRTDLQGGALSGRDFASRDDDGRRWNRIARASAFVSGVALIGFGIVWEMGIGDRFQYGPTETGGIPTVSPIPAGPPPSPTPPISALPRPGERRLTAQRSATPR